MKVESSPLPTITFVGRPHEIEIGIYVFRFLCAHFRRSWRENRGRLKSRRSFIYGMFCGIMMKLKIENPPATSGSAVEISRRDYLAREFPNLESVPSSRPPDAVADAALKAGFNAGFETEFRKGVQASDERRLISL